MEEHVAQLRAELDREEKERKHVQLQRDKMYGLLETTLRQMEDLKAEQTNVNKDMVEGERRHRAEIKVRKIQKIRLQTE